MFLIKLPQLYSDQEGIEKPFKELSLAYKIEYQDGLDHPEIAEGEKTHKGEEAIQNLIKELRGYYGEHYNCSCAR